MYMWPHLLYLVRMRDESVCVCVGGGGGGVGHERIWCSNWYCLLFANNYLLSRSRRFFLLDPMALSVHHHLGQLETAYAGACGLGKGLLLWQRHFEVLATVNFL